MAVRPQIIAASALFAAVGMATLVGAAKARQRRPPPTAAEPTNLGTVPGSKPIGPADPFEVLPLVTFHYRSSGESLAIRLYARTGKIDESAAARLDLLLADTRDPKHPESTQIDRRLLQLLFRTAYHFEASRIEVTSAYRMQRRRREGLHAQGRAVDFAIPGVRAAELASYLRKLPRVGVGIYTHPRTQFVHLDVRPQSYHWLDASPPGRAWRGLSLGDKSMKTRDAAYRRQNDWPEGLPTPESS